AGVELLQPEVGEFVTSLDMSGCSLTLCWADDELARWWKAPAATPGFRHGEVSQLPEFPALGVAHGPDQEDQAVASDASPASRQTAKLVRAAL
ncbi:dihydroxyacetone kinase subunit DhaK, partial [Klebsiella pneumoniae]|uniref:dihydroxyacetone kinase subunit DhaK n=1 Tax=Klebsiella pneumoniae TaxID=573 RepID=UPI003013B36F